MSRETGTHRMTDAKKGLSSLVSRGTIIDAAVGLVLLVLTFSAVALSDVSSAAMHAYWIALSVVFAAATFAADRAHSDHGLMHAKSAFGIVLHWFGVLCALQLVYFFVSTGRMANADTGLANGLLLGVGAFLAGVHVNWRFLILGTAIGAAAAGIAFVEEYLWVLFAIAVLAMVGLVAGIRVSRRQTPG